MQSDTANTSHACDLLDSNGVARIKAALITSETGAVAVIETAKGLCIRVPRNSRIGKNIEHIIELDKEAVDRDFDLHRRELTVLPITTLLEPLNARFIHGFCSSEEWNRCVDNFLTTCYEHFSDYVRGMKWSHSLNSWFQIGKPSLDEASLVIGDLMGALETFNQPALSENLNEENKGELEGVRWQLPTYILGSAIARQHNLG